MRTVKTLAALAVVLVSLRAGAEEVGPVEPSPSPSTSPSSNSSTLTEPIVLDENLQPLTRRSGGTRTSLAIESIRAAWRKPGFRLALGMGYGRLEGLEGVPSGRLLGAVLRMGARLDRDWSMMSTFQYLSASETDGLSALRFAGTLEPTWHVTDRFSLAVGVGFGGLVEGRTLRPDPEPHGNEINDSITLPTGGTPLPRCQGVGVAGVLRADWMAAFSRRTSTGFAAELLGQWTACVDDTNRVEPDTGEPIVRRQYWPHVGLTLSWLLQWR